MVDIVAGVVFADAVVKRVSTCDSGNKTNKRSDACVENSAGLS